MITRERQLVAAIRMNFHAYLQKAFTVTSAGEGFSANWHIEAIAWHLEQCVNGGCKRLIITLPPRNLKSISASVALPTWILGHKPTCNIICVSYSDSLARDFSRDRRKVMESDWYRKAFPKTRFDPKKNTETEIHTSKGGKCIATSTGGTLTGKGGNYIILDDPMKADDAFSEAERERVLKFFRNTLLSRLNNKTEDVIIIVTQRLHIDDLVANVQELDDWTVLNLPAIATEAYEEIQIGDNRWHERYEGDVLHPEREPMTVLENLKQGMGSMFFAAQYQQSPVPEGGNMFKKTWFNFYKGEPRQFLLDTVIQSWDTATETGEGNDYSVCVTCGIKDQNLYVLHVLRERMNFPTLLSTAKSHARKWGANAVIIEAANSGTPLYQTLRQEQSIPVVPVRPRLDKITRASHQSMRIEAGKVWLPEGEEWVPTLLSEFLAFPHGKYDDQVDALVQLLAWATEERIPQLAAQVTVLGEPGLTVRDKYFERNGVSVFDNLL